MNGDVLLNQEFYASGLTDKNLPKESLLGLGGPLTLQEIGELIESKLQEWIGWLLKEKGTDLFRSKGAHGQLTQ